MNVVIRADANRKIGMGHIMRCFSIADAFASAGHHVSFILADGTVENLVKSRGYDVVVMNSDYTKMEEENWPFITKGVDVIIVDSYYVTTAYLQSLLDKINRAGGKLVYIDDVFSFPYPVDILVNYNAYSTPGIYEKLYKGSGICIPELILTPTYAPLRKMFREIPKRSQPEMVQNILISTGGSDELHLSFSLVKKLIEKKELEKTYHILLGALNKDSDIIKGLARDNIVLYENVSDMKSLIERMDIAISAAGSTLYEICACGVPLITFSIADNQIPGAEAFERLGLGINVGDLREYESINTSFAPSGSLDSSAVGRILSALQLLSVDYEERCKMGIRMQELIDGFGAERLVGIITNIVKPEYVRI